MDRASFKKNQSKIDDPERGLCKLQMLHTVFNVELIKSGVSLILYNLFVSGMVKPVG